VLGSAEFGGERHRGVVELVYCPQRRKLECRHWGSNLDGGRNARCGGGRGDCQAELKKKEKK
jgi:hypothetical protein